jgi:hypothetical protein
MRLMRLANDLFEWIVMSSQLNGVLVIPTVILRCPFPFIALVDSFGVDSKAASGVLQ